jgi:hypothetical protein
VQVFGLHEQFNVLNWAMHMQFARPPALRGQVSETPELDTLGVIFLEKKPPCHAH